jgi:hypothetical protein
MFLLPRYPMPFWLIWLFITVNSFVVGVAVWFLTLFWDSNLNLVKSIIDHLLTGFIFAGLLVFVLPFAHFNLEQEWVIYTFVGIAVSIVIWIVVPGDWNAPGKKGSAGSRHGGK